MENKINYIDKVNIKKIIDENKESYVVVLDGIEIKNKEQFFSEMIEAFKLPPVNGWDAFTDWMTDLSWIKNKNIILIILNSQSFLINDKKDKQIVNEIFEEDILPFWEKEVTQTVVNGETKKFNLYYEI